MQCLEPLQILPPGPPGNFSDTVFGKIIDRELNRMVGRRHTPDLVRNANWAYLERGQDSYSYEVETPCTGADAPLLFERHKSTFADYRRICLRWAGFPGWELMPGGLSAILPSYLSGCCHADKRHGNGSDRLEVRVQRRWRNVGSVRPRYSEAFDVRLGKVLWIAQRSEHRSTQSVKKSREIHSPGGPIRECESQTVRRDHLHGGHKYRVCAACRHVCTYG